MRQHDARPLHTQNMVQRYFAFYLYVLLQIVFSLSRMCDNQPQYNKAYLPLGSGDRVRRIKQKAVASFKFANPTKPDGGINSFPSSTRVVQLLGGVDNIIYNHAGPYDVDAGCCVDNSTL
jgi:hypothetical protein